MFGVGYNCFYNVIVMYVFIVNDQILFIEQVINGRDVGVIVIDGYCGGFKFGEFCQCLFQFVVQFNFVIYYMCSVGMSVVSFNCFVSGGFYFGVVGQFEIVIIRKGDIIFVFNLQYVGYSVVMWLKVGVL